MRKLAVTAIACFSMAGYAAEEQSYSVGGLEQPAEIMVDEWGVPHIYANTHYDAFFVQGFNAARDRLWQIDTWRRRGLGLLSEVFGARYLEQDRAARLLLYRGDMYREWLAYGSDAKRIARAFTAGINAYVDLLGEHPELMPPEFELLDSGVFDQDRYFDVYVEYAKVGPEDILMRISVHNRGDQAAVLHLLP